MRLDEHGGRRRTGGIGARGMAAVTSGLVLILAGGCLGPNDDHCMFHGGDFACDGPQICIVPEADAPTPDATDENGCHDLEPETTRGELRLDEQVPADYVRAPFGVLLQFDLAIGDDPKGSLHGVMLLVAEERGTTGCSAGEIEDLRPDWLDVLERVRERVLRKRRARASRVLLEPSEIMPLTAFNRRVWDRIDGCVGGGTGTTMSPETGVATDSGMATDSGTASDTSATGSGTSGWSTDGGATAGSTL